MQTNLDRSTIEIARTKLRLRSTLKFTPQMYRDESFFHIECDTESRYFRIGYAEYVFVSLLDGNTSFSEALAITARTLGPSALPQAKALNLYEWLLENKLGSLSESVQNEQHSSGYKPKPQPFLARLNPFWIRIPLGNPTALLKYVRPVAGWIFSGPATLCAIGIMLFAAMRLFAQWNQFTSGASQILSPSNWAWMLVTWVVLKLIHETAHGLVCQRYGGQVKDAGIMLAFFTPLAYVDVSSCWAFRSKWQRIHTAAAGMYIELLIASLAVFGWSWSADPLARSICYNVVFTAGLSTILFNANPLMKFDGYFILSDLIQIPNLYAQASEKINQLIGNFLFGTNHQSPQSIHKRPRILGMYGAAALFWRVLIMASMLLAASVMLQGAGLILAFVATIAWFGLPAWNMFRKLSLLASESPLSLVRGLVVCSGFAGLVTAACLLIPAPSVAVAPGIIELPENSLVRASIDGFVEELRVQDGDSVQQGDILLTLTNELRETKHNNLAIEIEQEQIRYQKAIQDHDSDQASVIRSKLRSLRLQLGESQEHIDGLTIRAPVTGKVVARRLSELTGTYLHEGDEILDVEPDESRQFRVSVDQRDFAQAQSLLSQPVEVRVGTRDKVSGTLTRLNPRASRTIPHPALAANMNGPLAVVASSEDDSEDDKDQFELIDERFDALIELTASPSEPMFTRERGQVSFGCRSESIGRYCHRVVSEWIEKQLERALEVSS